MYIVTAKEMYDIDHYIMHEIGMDGRLLMENAGRAVSERIAQIADAQDRISVLIGPGNNGGDGFVIARTLQDKGFSVRAIQIVSDEKITGDALYHKNLLMKCSGIVNRITEISDVREIVRQSDIVIDAMLGIGVKGKLKKPLAGIISILNEADVCVMSVDIPTGLPVDEGVSDFLSIMADYTFIIGFIKQSTALEKTAAYYGKWELLSIGFPRWVIQRFTKRRFWTEADFSRTLPPRNTYAHKGNHGRGLLIGGSAEMPGSIAMATRSALKAGAGLITAGSTESAIAMIAPTCPEAMYMVLNEQDGKISSTPELSVQSYNAIALGIGLGRWKGTTELVQSIVQQAQCPVIIDADGLYHLKSDLHLLKNRSFPVILTPHPGEMAMLLDISISDLLTAPFQYSVEFAKEFGVYIVLKGKNTIITAPDGKQAIESSGNPGLAKGGSGDVLTGITLAMIMQEQSIFEAVCNACFIHGKSADLQVKEKHSHFDLLATDVIDGIPNVYRTFS
ncbi:NAD(P)H-hydrate dehydratase [Oceanobacillus massiliensis]|uniref:NAD(P)H-hydrate dehydratase n=1 Tax=Oceanobacillus massiliensis TaxID=1465765 RepID=UPI00301782DB